MLAEDTRDGETIKNVSGAIVVKDVVFAYPSAPEKYVYELLSPVAARRVS